MLKSFRKKVLIIIGISFALFIIESIIKYIFINKIPEQGFYLFERLFQIGYFTNQNIAFGLPLPQPFIIIIVIIILIILSYFWWLALIKQNSRQLFAISLIILGALSNLIDRLIFGHVIDYLNIFIWPVFNIADAMIVIGVLLYIINNLNLKNKDNF